LYTAPKNNSH